MDRDTMLALLVRAYRLGYGNGVKDLDNLESQASHPEPQRKKGEEGAKVLFERWLDDPKKELT